jgi:hypothetical protein
VERLKRSFKTRAPRNCFDHLLVHCDNPFPRLHVPELALVENAETVTNP